MRTLCWYRGLWCECLRGIRKLLTGLGSRVLRGAILEVIDIEAVEVVVVVVKVAYAGLKHVGLSVPSLVHIRGIHLHLAVAFSLACDRDWQEVNDDGARA